jgi:hypothetical protein
MIYQKNVPNWERALRISADILLVAGALAADRFGGQPILVTTGLLFSAVFIVVTGFVGWCPACAMMGRKLKSKAQ